MPGPHRLGALRTRLALGCLAFRSRFGSRTSRPWSACCGFARRLGCRAALSAMSLRGPRVGRAACDRRARGVSPRLTWEHLAPRRGPGQGAGTRLRHRGGRRSGGGDRLGPAARPAAPGRKPRVAGARVAGPGPEWAGRPTGSGPRRAPGGPRVWPASAAPASAARRSPAHRACRERTGHGAAWHAGQRTGRGRTGDARRAGHRRNCRREVLTAHRRRAVGCAQQRFGPDLAGAGAPGTGSSRIGTSAAGAAGFGAAALRRGAWCSAAAAEHRRRVWGCPPPPSSRTGPGPGARCPGWGSCPACGPPPPARARLRPHARRAPGPPSVAAATGSARGRGSTCRSVRRSRWTTTA
ncbi:FHA containing domain protein [Mycobacterium intracellulare]|nr:FHA containing domain protein [Mycobacterium intracellulare]